jgi:hypothetical protein
MGGAPVRPSRPKPRVAQERDASGGIGGQLLERIDWLHPAASIDGSYRAKKATAPAVIRGLRATT